MKIKYVVEVLVWKQETVCSMLLLSEDGFDTNTVETGVWETLK